MVVEEVAVDTLAEDGRIRGTKATTAGGETSVTEDGARDMTVMTRDPTPDMTPTVAATASAMMTEEEDMIC